MKITVQKLGPIRQAEFTLGDLTILCGGNNTGKTYATIALFGFLSFWRNIFNFKASDADVSRLLKERAIELDIQDTIDDAKNILENGSKAYTKQLPHVFSSSEKHFSDSVVMAVPEPGEIHPKRTYERTLGEDDTRLFSMSKTADSPTLKISLLFKNGEMIIPRELLGQFIGDALKEIVFSGLFPNPFIAGAERTGAAFFRKELTFARSALLERMDSMEEEIEVSELLAKVYSDYTLPVKTNMDFTRKLEEISMQESFIARRHPELLNDFDRIIGGQYIITKNDELFYIPKGKRVKLKLDESSGAVRSLLDIGFYLRHLAEPGDLLMVDEPGLNLHPENQRRIARLFSRLVGLGVKVFITTHSDYIIKELNTLIMLNYDKPHLDRIAEREGYKKEELLPADKVRVYTAEEALVKLKGGKRKTRCQTMTPVDINAETGFEVRSFYEIIDKMNELQEEIVWGG